MQLIDSLPINSNLPVNSKILLLAVLNIILINKQLIKIIIINNFFNT